MNHWLTDPSLKLLKIGSVDWFSAQQRMIQRKPLIRRCYDLWYRRLLEDADSVRAPGAIVELGSGSSYIKSLRPDIITSDVTPGLADMAIDGRDLPFPDNSVAAILMTHVFHHVPDAAAFFREACRVLVPGGVISLVEVTHTPFAKWFFSRVHPEPYDDAAAEWGFPEGHSMLDSNQALSWMVFHRDRDRFAAEFPALSLECARFLPWLSYLLSGGVNLRNFVPCILAPAVVCLDYAFKPLDPLFAIHWHLRIRKLGKAAKQS